MPARSICTACHLRRVLLLQPHRCFSQDSSRTQQAQQQAASHPQGVHVYGRYSHKPLAPQRVLQDFLQPKAEKNDDQSRAHRRDNASETKPAQACTLSTPDLDRRYRQFLLAARSASTNPAADAHALRFLLHLGRDSRATGQPLTVPVAFRKSFARRCHEWLDDLSARWSRDLLAADRTATGVPTTTAVQPSQAVRAATALQWRTHAYLHGVLWPLAANTLAAKNSNNAIPTERIRVAVTELMLVWNLAMRMRLSPAPHPLSADLTDWSFLPDPVLFSESLRQKRQPGDADSFSFMGALKLLLPKDSTLGAQDAEALRLYGRDLHDFPSAALVTLDILNQVPTEVGGSEWTAPYESWMRLMQTVYNTVGDNRIPFALAQKLGNSEVKELYASVVQRFGLTVGPSINIPQSEPVLSKEGVNGSETTFDEARGDGSAQMAVASTSNDAIRSFMERCEIGLGRAVEREDVKAAKRVYDNVQRFAANAEQRLPLDFYEHLLHTFMSLRHRDVIVPIWNDMIRAGHQPTHKTYTILMRGCREGRDLQAMESFWVKMRTAGIQPDHYAWSTRLFGLLKNRRSVDDGEQALAAMARDWFVAARAAYNKEVSSNSKAKARGASVEEAELLAKFPGDVNDVPRPNVHIMNSAISALAGTKASLIPRVLNWGRALGIRPDITTCNVLMNVSFRQENWDGAMNILQKMRKIGIEPNSTTWTVLLTALFEGGTLDGLSTKEVGSRVLDMVRDLDSGSSGLDVKGYALCIDRLLKTYENYAAAEGIMEHMIAKGMQPTAEIYTILMTHYLQQSPPDFAAAESLWSRIRSDSRGYAASLDGVFFDRMIELYSPHYNTVGLGTMLSFLDTLESQGKRLSWRAMEHLAKALAGAGEEDKLVKLIDKAKRERDIGPGINREFGQASFWEFIASIGLVNRDVSTGAIEAVDNQGR